MIIRWTESYTHGHFIWNLWNLPKACFKNFIWNDHSCKILYVVQFHLQQQFPDKKIPKNHVLNTVNRTVALGCKHTPALSGLGCKHSHCIPLYTGLACSVFVQSQYLWVKIYTYRVFFCSYTRVVAHYPYVVLAAVLLVSVTCLIVTVVIGDVPSFEDPLAVCIL